MRFNAAIEKIMDDVRNGSTEPFIIYRNSHGEWHSDYTQNQYGERFGWVDGVKNQDHFALEYSGKDFSKASFSNVYYTVLTHRIHLEFDENKMAGMYDGNSFESYFEGMDEKEARALVSFIEDSIASFPGEVTDYLTTLERPFAAIKEMCPFNMATDNAEWHFNEDLAPDAVDYIKNTVEERLNNSRSAAKVIDGVEYQELCAADCKPGSRDADFTGKLIVVKASELKPEYRTSDSQLVVCSHGNGARPNAIGTSVFGHELLSGDSVCYGRHQIEGVANPAKMPDWAVEKMAIIESERAMREKVQTAPKPSLQDKLSKAKQKAAQGAAKNKDRADKPKKRKDMEV